MKIIHISDTHVGKADNAAKFDCVVQDIRSLLDDADDYLVVHTGDLLDHEAPAATPSGLGILDALSGRATSARALPVLLCPGNHDYGNARHIGRDHAERFCAAYASYIFGDQPRRFPVVQVFGNCAFIGLDSSQAELSWWTGAFAEGRLGREQIQGLAEILDKAEIKNCYKVVYLHHHPFANSRLVRPRIGDERYFKKLFNWCFRRFIRLKDADALLHCIRDRVDLLLFGHKHYGMDHSDEAARYGIPLALDASSTTRDGMDGEPMRYRIVDTGTGRVDCRLVTTG
jgi:3',5'-cyclic AMP phosphodiesterase CpdA